MLCCLRTGNGAGDISLIPSSSVTKYVFFSPSNDVVESPLGKAGHLQILSYVFICSHQYAPDFLNQGERGLGTFTVFPGSMIILRSSIYQ